MRKVYLDSAPVIDLVEQVLPFYTRLLQVIQSADVLIVSDLTRLECRVLPLRVANHSLLADYDAFFTTQVSEVVSLTSAILDKATEIRAFHRYSVADSIHLAAAIVSGCDLFLTNDLRLTGFDEIQVLNL